MAFVRRMKELGALCQEGRSLAPLGKSRAFLPGTSGVSCPCFQLELGLPDPNKLGPPYVYGHCLLPGGFSCDSSGGSSLSSTFCHSFSFWAGHVQSKE